MWPNAVAIVVYSCLATAPLDDFNPHQVGAVQAYVARHPGICSVEPPLILEADVSFEVSEPRLVALHARLAGRAP